MLRFRALASAAIVFLLALCVSSVLAALLSGQATSVGAVAGSMDAMSIDMNPSTSPANTATSLGSRETCARINENDALDADEDAVDALTIDITATNIPTTNKMIAFAYELDYPTDLNVTAKNQQFLLNSGAGSSTLDSSESLPDSDGAFNASAADTSSSPSSRESGSGVLHRIELSTIPTAGVGIFPLTIPPGSAAHVDPNNNSFPPNNLENASVAINTSCPLPPADIELVSLSLVSVSGPTVPTGSPFNLQVTAMATNHGPNPADIRFDLNVAAPGDCTLAPPTNQTEDFLT
jgi:hypothetical protein